jgi:hypothetical protein
MQRHCGVAAGAAAAELLREPGEAADAATVMTCWTCGGDVVFSEEGWVHTDPDGSCAQLVVAWPPPVFADDD